MQESERNIACCILLLYCSYILILCNRSKPSTPADASYEISRHKKGEKLVE